MSCSGMMGRVSFTSGSFCASALGIMPSPAFAGTHEWTSTPVLKLVHDRQRELHRSVYCPEGLAPIPVAAGVSTPTEELDAPARDMEGPVSLVHHDSTWHVRLSSPLDGVRYRESLVCQINRGGAYTSSQKRYRRQTPQAGCIVQQWMMFACASGIPRLRRHADRGF